MPFASFPPDMPAREELGNSWPLSAAEARSAQNHRSIVGTSSFAVEASGLGFTPTGLEWWRAAFCLIVVVIGAGVMALPQLPQKGGTWLSVVALIMCGLAITESGLVMWRGWMASNPDNDPDTCQVEESKNMESYEDFGRASFGELGESSVLVSVVFYFIGCSAGFVSLIASSLELISNNWWDNKTWLLVLYPVFAGMAMIPDVTCIAKLTPLAVVAILALCGTIVIKSLIDAQRWHAWPHLHEEALHRSWPASPLDLGTVVATMFGAFGVNGNVPSVLCKMKDPMQFPLAFKTAMISVGLIYLAVMGCGYYGYGEFMQANIIESLTSFPANQSQAFNTPVKEWTGPKAIALQNILSSLLLVKLIIGLPLNLMVIFYSVQTYKYSKNHFPVGSKQNMLMRAIVVALAELIVVLIPDFNKLFALVCSIFGPLLQVIFPLLFAYKIQSDQIAPRNSLFLRSLHAAMMVLAVFTITIGFWESLSDVLWPSAQN
jgi:amino acid permease